MLSLPQHSKDFPLRIVLRFRTRKQVVNWVNILKSQRPNSSEAPLPELVHFPAKKKRKKRDSQILFNASFNRYSKLGKYYVLTVWIFWKWSANKIPSLSHKKHNHDSFWCLLGFKFYGRGEHDFSDCMNCCLVFGS